MDTQISRKNATNEKGKGKAVPQYTYGGAGWRGGILSTHS
jgi:hypothetical protein